MTSSLNTSQAVSEKKLGRLKDLLTPILRRHLKTESQAQALIEARSFVEGFDLLVKGLVGKLTNTFVVTVDYVKSLPEMIKVGNYDYVNEDITDAHFRMTGKGKVDREIVLVHFDRDITSEEALQELDKLGLRPVDLAELLAFGETHPEAHLEFPILALGSIWMNRDDGRGYFPYLSYEDDKHVLLLYWFGGWWHDYCRFAAVRK